MRQQEGPNRTVVLVGHKGEDTELLAILNQLDGKPDYYFPEVAHIADDYWDSTELVPVQNITLYTKEVNGETRHYVHISGVVPKADC